MWCWILVEHLRKCSIMKEYARCHLAQWRSYVFYCVSCMVHYRTTENLWLFTICPHDSRILTILFSGIMAILFCGLVMSHYTHYNLSPVTQITMQQTMRTLAFVCETSIFIYLGLGIFSFPHRFELSLVIWSLVLILIGEELIKMDNSTIIKFCYTCNHFKLG